MNVEGKGAQSAGTGSRVDPAKSQMGEGRGWEEKDSKEMISIDEQREVGGKERERARRLKVSDQGL